MIRRSQILNNQSSRPNGPFSGLTRTRYKKVSPKVLDESIVNMSQEMKGYEINKANRPGIGSWGLGNKNSISSRTRTNPKAQVSSGQRYTSDYLICFLSFSRSL